MSDLMGISLSVSVLFFVFFLTSFVCVLTFVNERYFDLVKFKFALTLLFILSSSLRILRSRVQRSGYIFFPFFFLNLAHLLNKKNIFLSVVPQKMPKIWPSEVRHYCGIALLPGQYNTGMHRRIKIEQ